MLYDADTNEVNPKTVPKYTFYWMLKMKSMQIVPLQNYLVAFDALNLHQILLKALMRSIRTINIPHLNHLRVLKCSTECWTVGFAVSVDV